MEESINDIPADHNDRTMMTVREVAQLLSIHANTVRRWNNRGILKGYRISPRGDRRFPQGGITRFLAQLHANGGDERKASSNQT